MGCKALERRRTRSQCPHVFTVGRMLHVPALYEARGFVRRQFPVVLHADLPQNLI